MPVSIKLPNGEVVAIQTDDPKAASAAAKKIWANKQASASAQPSSGEKPPERGMYDKVSTGIYTGLTKRGIGIIQTLDDLLGGSILTPEFRAASYKASQNLDNDMKGTGAAGFVGKLAGDPVNWAAPAMGPVAAGATIGGASALTDAESQDDGQGLYGRAKRGAGGATIGAVAGKVVPAVAGKTKDLAVGLVDRLMSAAGNENAAARIVYRMYAQKLLDNGLDEAAVTQAIQKAQASGLTPTLAEATGSRGLMQFEKRLASMADKAGQNFNENLATRAEDTIPAKITEMGKSLIKTPQELDALYTGAADEAAASNTGALTKQLTALQNVKLSDWDSRILKDITDHYAANGSITPFQQNVVDKLAAESGNAPVRDVSTLINGIRSTIADRMATSKSDIERKAYTKVLKVLGDAGKNGPVDFPALQEIKKALDEPIIEGADIGAEKLANSHIFDFKKTIDDAMGKLAPASYPAAKSAAKANFAGQDILDALDSTKKEGLRQFYDTVWGTPDARADFLRKLPDDPTRAKFTDFFDNMEGVVRGFGGKEVKPPAGNALESETIGLAPGWANPLGWGGRAVRAVGELFTPNVYEQAAKASWAPDAEKLVLNMNRQSGNYGANLSEPASNSVRDVLSNLAGNVKNNLPDVLGITGNAAAGVTAGAIGDKAVDKPVKPGPLKLTITPEDKQPTPAVNLPQVGPQSSIADLFRQIFA